MGAMLTSGDKHILIRALALDSIDELRMISNPAKRALDDAGIKTLYDLTISEPSVLERLDVSDDDRDMIDAVKVYLIENPTFP